MTLILKSIKFTEKQLQELKKIAERDDRNINWLVRKAVDKFIQKSEKKNTPKTFIASIIFLQYLNVL
ncbi:hypothetical protein DSECCO2_499500 [anaerobic digester metagenome]